MLDPQHTNHCPGCGVLRFAGPVDEPPYVGRCGACVQRDREPQGSPVRLFEPAPTQLPGQTSWPMAPGQTRRGSHYCRHCGTPEAMPGHEC